MHKLGAWCVYNTVLYRLLLLENSITGLNCALCKNVFLFQLTMAIGFVHVESLFAYGCCPQSLILVNLDWQMKWS